jgi:hypothetical protein
MAHALHSLPVHPITQEPLTPRTQLDPSYPTTLKRPRAGSLPVASTVPRTRGATGLLQAVHEAASSSTREAACSSTTRGGSCSASTACHEAASSSTTHFPDSASSSSLPASRPGFGHPLRIAFLCLGREVLIPPVRLLDGQGAMGQTCLARRVSGQAAFQCLT